MNIKTKREKKDHFLNVDVHITNISNNAVMLLV